ncbi:MAG: DsrE family protein [Thiohalomonas sp.]|nr:DsrE family protein [Thiohalomonas sp.]
MKNIRLFQVLFITLFHLFFWNSTYAENNEPDDNITLSELSLATAQYVDTPYSSEQKVLFEFFLDEPAKINAALYWLRSYMNTLIDEPYSLAPEFMHVIVLIHGTEIVTLAKKNYAQYKTAVQRMRYYEELGVEFRVCGDGASDYGYTAKDFHGFVKIIPSAIVELAHWQTQGYAVIRPLVFEKKHSIDEIR